MEKLHATKIRKVAAAAVLSAGIAINPNVAHNSSKPLLRTDIAESISKPTFSCVLPKGQGYIYYNKKLPNQTEGLVGFFRTNGFKSSTYRTEQTGNMEPLKKIIKAAGVSAASVQLNVPIEARKTNGRIEDFWLQNAPIILEKLNEFAVVPHSQIYRLFGNDEVRSFNKGEIRGNGSVVAPHTNGNPNTYQYSNKAYIFSNRKLSLFLTISEKITYQNLYVTFEVNNKTFDKVEIRGPFASSVLTSSKNVPVQFGLEGIGNGAADVFDKLSPTIFAVFDIGSHGKPYPIRMSLKGNNVSAEESNLIYKRGGNGMFAIAEIQPCKP